MTPKFGGRMITIKQKGDFKKLDRYFKRSVKTSSYENINLVNFAERCIERLREATPKNTGLTANSWRYEIIKRKNSRVLRIHNTNIQNGINIALLKDFGHATRSGTWIEGQNYIEPEVRKTYLDILNNTWKEMKRL